MTSAAANGTKNVANTIAGCFAYGGFHAAFAATGPAATALAPVVGVAILAGTVIAWGRYAAPVVVNEKCSNCKATK